MAGAAVVVLERNAVAGRGLYIYLFSLLRPDRFCDSNSCICGNTAVTKSVCPTAAAKCLPDAICPHSRWRSQPLSSVSRKQRYNTLDFPTENRVPTGMLLAPIGNPDFASKIVCQQGCFSTLLETQSRGISPLWTPPIIFCACVYTTRILHSIYSALKIENRHSFHLLPR